MSADLYSASVPVFSHYLGQLGILVERTAGREQVLAARLAPDMFTAAQQVATLATALNAHGIGKGDRVVLVSENRPEWCIADLAIMAAGAITVPTYTTNTERDHLHILENSGAKAAMVVRMVPATGMITSEVPRMHASLSGTPSSISR